MAYESMNTKYAKAKIVIGAYEFNSDEYRIDSISITTGVYDGSVVGVGNTYTAMCTITMQDIEEVVLGTALSVYFEINGTFQNFGKFWVNSQPVINGDVMTLNCHGALGQQGSSAFWYPGMYYTNEVTTIGNLLTGITEVSEMSTLEFDTDADLTDFLNKPITVPLKESSFTPIDEIYYSNNHGISKREFLAGIAILFGGNVSERNGIVYIIPKTPDAGRERAIFTTESYADHRLSRESYGVNMIAIDYMPTRYGGFFGLDPSVTKLECQFYSGDERKRRLMLASQTSGLGANVTYDQVVECDWIGYSVETGDMNCAMQSDLKYRSGEYTFVGYNENLYAGNIVDIEHDNGETVSFYIGEMTLEWDGGFTTTVSCNCDVDVSTGTYNSSTSSTVTANKVSSSAQNAENKVSFADITFSNVKDSTISGSKFIDGTITESKIADSAITGSKIKDSTITGAKIDFSTFENGSIKGASIDASTFTDGQISGSVIDTSTFKDGTISGSVIESSTLKDIPYASMDEAFIGDLTTDSLFTKNIESTVANIKTLKASDAIIKNIFSESIISDSAVIDVLRSNAIDAEYIKSATADIGYLTADKADIRYASITLGNIDTANINKSNIGLLFNEVGLIDRATIVDGHVTGFLDAVEVNADKITAGTLVTDRLIIRGNEKSILYEINNIQSKNLVIYPYLETTHTKNGVTFTDVGDGTIIANGTATETAVFTYRTRNEADKQLILPAGTYTISGCPAGGSSTKYRIIVGKTNQSTGEYATIANDYGYGATFTLTEDTQVGVACRVESGTTVNNIVFKPMLQTGSIATEYEPYRKRIQELTGETINGEVLTPRTINADRIIAESITTTELDSTQIFSDEAVIKQIFAQNVTATGKITGATLIGAYAEVDSGKIGAFDISDSGLVFKDDSRQSEINKYGVTSGWSNTGDGIYSSLSQIGSTGFRAENLNHVVMLDTQGRSNTETDMYTLWLSNYINGSAGGTLYVDYKDVEYGITGIVASDYRVYENGTIEDDVSVFKISAGKLILDGNIVSSSKITVDVGDETVNALNLSGNIEYTMYGYTGLPLKIWGGDGTGMGVTLGAGGCTIIGGGESGRQFESIVSSANAEQLYLTSDNNIHFFTKCNTIENRAHVTLDTSRQFYPVTSSTTGAGSIGTSTNQWATGYIYDMHTNDIDSVTYKQKGKDINTLYSVVASGTDSFSGTGAWKSTTVAFGKTYASPPLVSILPTSQFASENIRFVSFTGNSKKGYGGMTYEVYGQTSGFPYSVRWMAIGNVKI